ncbi:MAG: ChaB family protein [Dehalococcoidia bacterium]|nr:ChaB family protein [Dehalococcoidia bacterium]
MPYAKLSDLPDNIKALPKHAQEIYQGAFNSAFDQYKGDEAKSAATAWAAVENKYKKDGKGNWVAKEAALQEIYSEIIQEIGKRNASTDAGRIKQIMALCQELLSSEPTEESVRDAIKECESVLSWLREQDLVKTEDGVKYPAEAYAYAPENPSDWRLRIREGAVVTLAQLGRAAAYLSPGGYKGKKADIPSTHLSEVKRILRSEYTKLGVEEMPKWIQESMTRELVSDYIPLTEAKYDGGTAMITVIKPGFNAGKGRFYPKEMLARDYGIFEGAKMYADHPTENDETQRPERSIKDWVASLTNVKLNEKGEVVGKATVIEPWMQEKLALLRDKGMLNQMGVSINAVGSASDAEIEGVKTKLVEKLIRARSVDFVTEAGAGGTVNLYESIENDIDLIDLVSLKERRPDLVDSIESAVKSEIKQEVHKKMELETRIKELEAQITTLTTERDGLQTQLTEAKKAEDKAKAQGLIKEAVSKAELPEAAKARILESFKEALNTDGLEEAIKFEVGYIANIAEAGKVKGLGGSAPDDKKAHEALVESFMKTGMSKERAEIAASGR